MNRVVPVSTPHDPGVFFGIADEEYHSAFALSASGIKHIRASTLDFWVRSPLNPDQADVDTDEDTDAKMIGRAYHKRIVEGKEAFGKLYAPTLQREDYPYALETMGDLRAHLKLLSLKVGGNKDELIARVREGDPNIAVWDVLQENYIALAGGRTLLTPALIKKIEIAAAMIEKHPQLGKAFTGGYPEVAIFWTDPEFGVPMKAKLDYLKRAAIIDLKTFTNVLGMPVDKAIAREIANRKYHIQARLYLDAVRQARAFIRDGRVFGDVEKEFLKSVAANTEHTFMFVFQQKGIAPLARGKILPALTLDVGLVEINDAKWRFAEAWKKFGSDPWIDESEIATFDPTEFPAYIAD